MDLKLFLRTLLRRWPILLGVVALASASTYMVVDRVGATYETVGSTLVFPPADADGPGPDPAGGNPYLALSGLSQARDIVIRTLTSKSVRTELEETYPGMSYEAAPDFTNDAPIVLFTVEAPTTEASTQALRDLMGRVPATLAELQAGQALSEQARITSVALTEDLEPDTLHKKQIRAGILVAAGVLGAGLLLIALVDGMLAARRRRRGAGTGDEQQHVPDPGAAPPTAAPEDKPTETTATPHRTATTVRPHEKASVQAAAKSADVRAKREEEPAFVRSTRLVSVREHRRTGGEQGNDAGRAPVTPQGTMRGTR